MTQNSLQIGDTVQLKSGGPLMTIENIADFNARTQARCLWFDGTDQKSGVFPLETLIKEE